MRWFFSFTITSALVATTAGLLWLRKHSILGASKLSDAAAWLIPDSAASVIVQYQVLLMVVLNLVVLTALDRWIAYTSSATDSSPRNVGTIWTTVWRSAYTLFHNPTRWWLTTFTLLVTLVTMASGVWVRLFDVTKTTETAWGLTLLFWVTLVAAMANPDAPDPLRATLDSRPDPILEIPGEPADAEEPEAA